MSQEHLLTDLQAFHRDRLRLEGGLELVARGITYGILKPADLDSLYRAFLNVAFRGEIELLDSPRKSMQQVASEAARAHVVRMGRCFESGPIDQS